MAKCNVDAIVGAELLSRFREHLTEEEEEQVRQKFTGLCFYETFGRRDYRECFCTKCEQTYGVEKDYDRDFFKEHHNDWTYCPYCREEVQLKSLGRIKKFDNLDETIPAVFIRVDREGALMISAGLATRHIPGWNELSAQVEWREKARYYLSPGRVMGWKRSIDFYFGMIMGPQPWKQMKNIGKPFQNDPWHGRTDHYWLFGLESLEQSKFRYCQIEDWYQEEAGGWLSGADSKVRLCIEYLAEYALHPQMEMAVKLGLTSAVTDLCDGRKNHRDLNWRADKPWDLLRLNKTDAKAFLMCPSMTLLQWIHEEQRAGAQISVGEMVRLWSSFGGAQARKLASCALRCGASPQKAERYLLSVPGVVRGQAAELWYDYLDMAKELGYDLSRPDVLMPKDLRERHDAAAQTIQVKKDEKTAKAYAKRLKMLREKYEFELDGLRVMVPETAGQIVEEGKTLKHCVGGYAARHIQGKTTILFLRRARRPERSYITIEMYGTGQTDIMQIHGYKNENYKGSISPKKRYEHFLAVWQGWLKAGSKRDRQGRPILPGERKEGVA